MTALATRSRRTHNSVLCMKNDSRSSTHNCWSVFLVRKQSYKKEGSALINSASWSHQLSILESPSCLKNSHPPTSNFEALAASRLVRRR